MSRRTGRSRKRAQEEKEAVEEEVKVKKEFNDYIFVENLLKLRKEEEILKYLSENLLLPDYLTDLNQSIILDFQIYNTMFCVENRFDINKSIHFLHLLNDIFEKCKQENICMEDILEVSKKRLLEYTFPTVRDPLEIKMEEIEAVSKKKDGSGRRKKKKVEGTARTKAGSGRKRAAKGSVPQEPEKLKELPPVFSSEESGRISKFMVDGFLQHFYLFQFVHNNPRPRKVRKVKKMMIYPVTDIPPHTQFLDEESYEKELIERKEAKKQIQKEKEEAEMLEMERMNGEEEVKRREMEERANAPVLKQEELIKVSEFLKYHLEKEYHERSEKYVNRIDRIQKMIDGEYVEEKELQPVPKKKKSSRTSGGRKSSRQKRN